jgi:toxin YoeB
LGKGCADGGERPSRRIDREHRLVYTISESKIRIIACRYHY